MKYVCRQETLQSLCFLVGLFLALGDKIPDELEEFLDHIEHCSSCYDELETYFIVHEAIQQLDEKEDGTVLDFRELLEQDIRRSRRYIRQKRWLHFLSVIFFMAVVIAAGSFVVFLVMEVTHFL